MYLVKYSQNQLRSQYLKIILQYFPETILCLFGCVHSQNNFVTGLSFMWPEFLFIAVPLDQYSQVETSLGLSFFNINGATVNK